MARKQNVFTWVPIVSALLGVVGGALSGGFAAYTQRRTSQEQFSIERARMFMELIKQLQNESTSRMALLNLWQLYPDKRDQKIIVAAAIESGQPDLVETIIGFEEEILQLAEILHAKALLGERSALQTLARIDSVRAASVMVDSIGQDIRRKGDGYFANDMTRELRRISQGDDKVVHLIRTAGERFSNKPLMFDYLLYDASAESHFVRRIVNGYQEKKELKLLNEFLSQADFKQSDAPNIFASARDYVVDALERSESNQYRLIGALGGLKNNSFALQLSNGNNQVFARRLGEAVNNVNNPDPVRQRAFALLRKISRKHALSTAGAVLAQASAGTALKSEIEQQLPGLFRAMEDDESSFKRPKGCEDARTSPKECMEKAAAWAEWLEGVLDQ